MKARGYFITGTDTGVGKTWVTTHLLTLLRQSGRDAVGMKPIECGGRDDARALLAAIEEDKPSLSLDQINPYALPEPLAPIAMLPPPEISFPKILSHYQALTRQHDCVLVEGAGGWLVPLDPQRTFADLASNLALPVLLVAANRLGVLNHTLLTVSAIEASGLSCLGVFLNELDPADDADDHSRRSNARALRECLPNLPVIDGDLPALAKLLQET